MLTWIMFLKFLDDMEQIREQEAKMRGERSTRPSPLGSLLDFAPFRAGKGGGSLLFSGKAP